MQRRTCSQVRKCCRNDDRGTTSPHSQVPFLAASRFLKAFAGSVVNFPTYYDHDQVPFDNIRKRKRETKTEKYLFRLLFFNSLSRVKIVPCTSVPVQQTKTFAATVTPIFGHGPWGRRGRRGTGDTRRTWGRPGSPWPRGSWRAPDKPGRTRGDTAGRGWRPPGARCRWGTRRCRRTAPDV